MTLLFVELAGYTLRRTYEVCVHVPQFLLSSADFTIVVKFRIERVCLRVCFFGAEWLLHLATYDIPEY